jgi:hypothetical protein
MAFANSIRGFWSAIAEGSWYVCGTVFDVSGVDKRLERQLGGLFDYGRDIRARISLQAACRGGVINHGTADSCSQRRSSGKDRKQKEVSKK